MGQPMPPLWPQPDGSPVSCREKIKVLEENWAEVCEVVRDAFEDAVLMGVDPEAMRRRLAEFIGSLAVPGKSRT